MKPPPDGIEFVFDPHVLVAVVALALAVLVLVLMTTIPIEKGRK